MSALSPFLSYGFRPFFLAAAVLATVAIALWLGVYTGYGGGIIPVPAVPPLVWHAHEMVFGYSLAVIAGFLLTAVRNWTQLPGVEGRALAWLLLLWLVPRVLLMTPLTAAPAIAFAFDMAFVLALALGVAVPIVKSGQLRRQAGIIAKLALIAASNTCFYWALLTEQGQWLLPSLYSGLYLVVALCMTLARRLIPFFVKSATQVDVPNRAWLDRSSLVLFFAFWACVVMTGHGTLTAIFAAGLCTVHLARLNQWRVKGLLRSPLLWVLYAAYAFFILGFALVAAIPITGLSQSLAIHAFAMGGIGTLTIGMMARVSWGHTGRDLTQPPRGMAALFLLIVCAGLLRVFGPLLVPQWYSTWVLLAGVGWVAAFTWFLVLYLPVWTRPRASD